MRIYPHLQDTGGFFVAVLERKPQQNSHASVAAYVPVPSFPQNIPYGSSRKRDAEEADVAVPEAKKVKLDLSVPPEFQESFPPTPMSEDDGSHPLVLATVETEAQDSSKTEKVSLRGKFKISDPSFKEMPYTFLEPNDPALISCMFVLPHDRHHHLWIYIHFITENSFILRLTSHLRTSLSAIQQVTRFARSILRTTS